MKRLLLISFTVLITSMSYSQGDTCVADFCYTAVLNTSTNMLEVTFENNSYVSPSPAVITDNYWDFGDGNTSTDENPALHYYTMDHSFYIVTLQILSSTSCVDTYTDTIYIVTATTCDTVTGVNTQNNLINSLINVYPNPTNRIITINGKDIQRIEIIDVNGKVVYQTNANKQKIDISNQAKGVYFVKVITAKGIETKKILIE